MSDKKDYPQTPTLGQLLDETDAEYMGLSEEALRKLKELPERRVEGIWDKI